MHQNASLKFNQYFEWSVLESTAYFLLLMRRSNQKNALRDSRSFNKPSSG